jgi:hypothetical protein
MSVAARSLTAGSLRANAASLLLWEFVEDQLGTEDGLDGLSLASSTCHRATLMTGSSWWKNSSDSKPKGRKETV